MLSQPISVTFDIGGGRMVTIETGKLARQADGAVTVRQGNCILLATVVANKNPKKARISSFISRLPGKICLPRDVSRIFL
jgi:polyribonucleotide nucleotidyltransferase